MSFPHRDANSFNRAVERDHLGMVERSAEVEREEVQSCEGCKHYGYCKYGGNISCGEYEKEQPKCAI